MTDKVAVKQAVGEPEVPVEVIAQAIVKVSEAAKKMREAGLKEEAIVLLLHDYTGVGKPHIRLILRALPQLRTMYTTK
jgi:hypothetical protein